MKGELIETAKGLVVLGQSSARQSDLKRAVSTAYYALFHALARNAADCMAGTDGEAGDTSWAHVYRAIEHGFARKACEQAMKLGFAEPITRCAFLFVELQDRRHAADYDSSFLVSIPEAENAIELAEEAIAALEGSSDGERRAFAIQLLLRRRG